jgi:hypothetical protein
LADLERREAQAQENLSQHPVEWEQNGRPSPSLDGSAHSGIVPRYPGRPIQCQRCARKLLDSPKNRATVAHPKARETLPISPRPRWPPVPQAGGLFCS